MIDEWRGRVGVGDGGGRVHAYGLLDELVGTGLVGDRVVVVVRVHKRLTRLARLVHAVHVAQLFVELVSQQLVAQALLLLLLTSGRARRHGRRCRLCVREVDDDATATVTGRRHLLLLLVLLLLS